MWGNATCSHGERRKPTGKGFRCSSFNALLFWQEKPCIIKAFKKKTQGGQLPKKQMPSMSSVFSLSAMCVVSWAPAAFVSVNCMMSDGVGWGGKAKPAQPSACSMCMYWQIKDSRLKYFINLHAAFAEVEMVTDTNKTILLKQKSCGNLKNPTRQLHKFLE